MNINQTTTCSKLACSNERADNDTNSKKFKVHIVKHEIGIAVIRADSLADAKRGAKYVHLEDIEQWDPCCAKIASVVPMTSLAEEIKMQKCDGMIDDTGAFSKFLATRRFYERLSFVLVPLALCLIGFLFCLLRF